MLNDQREVITSLVGGAQMIRDRIAARRFTVLHGGRHPCLGPVKCCQPDCSICGVWPSNAVRALAVAEFSVKV